MRSPSLALGVAACGLLAGCVVGPNYKRPPAPAPEAYKTVAPWREAAPKDSIPKGAWWEIYQDVELNGYEQQLLNANQSLIAAKDRLNQARALARVASAGYFPTFSIDPGYARTRYSGNRPEVVTLGNPLTQNNFQIPFLLNYEPNVNLVLTAELAADYFSLRELDAETQVVRDAVDIQKKGLQLVEARHAGGVASGLDLAQQQTLLDSTEAQLYLVQQQRAQFEHAIAVLTGNPASAFTVPVRALNAAPPPVPLGVPSDLLERRPDIATAERQMAFQNALVGVATAAFYPQLTIFGSGGLQSTDITQLFTAPSAVWAVGGDLLQPIFEGGRLRANLAATKSAYDESVANYRESVLTAFQEVEDGLSGLSALSEASITQDAAVADSRRALELANNRYVGGVTSYLDVITAQATLLSNQRLATQLLGQQMVLSVFLVKALGGGWDASQIQNEQVRPKAIQTIQQ